MPDINLQDHTIILQSSDGKSYAIEDPLQLMLDLAVEKLTTEDGGVNSAVDGAFEKIKAKIIQASGIPKLTASQTLQIIVGLAQFAGDLQKKIGLTPTSSPPLDTSPKASQSESAST